MEDIPRQMTAVLSKFNSIRGKCPADQGVPFWDLVVLTASDNAQAQAYRLQIDDKLERGQLPTGLLYLVYADPPGTRVGCGGSTMFVLSQLEARFGLEELKQWRVLLLNAGGQSQRLPSASVLGKIFTALPIEGFQMLDLKLALYLPFLERMSPGYFHPASDCIEPFAIDSNDEWNFTEPGITAFAHPSSLKMGTGHGVYVLEEDKHKGPQQKTEFRKCLKVLQKPSIQMMRDEGAVRMDNQQNEFVYTDSLFFFDHGIAMKLAAFYRKNAPLNCEIDSYGDFLQPLGPLATIDYTLNTKNVSKVEKNLVEMRQKVFHLLKGTELHIVCLNTSQFYHYGTFEEYIFHITKDKVVQAELTFLRIVNSRFTRLSDKPVRKVSKISQDGCIMHSLLPDSSVIPLDNIVEYFHSDIPLQLGSKCVISNCQYIDGNLLVLAVPDNSFMHTACISINGKASYVTVAFNITDNLKQKTLLQDAGSMQYFGQPLDQACAALKLDLNRHVFPGKKSGEKCSLWEAKLFPTAATMTASLEASLEVLALIGGAGDMMHARSRVVSMADVMEFKDVSGMLSFRNKLCDQISKEL